LNYVWEPKFDSLANPAVWLAAAGQIFFTLGVGWGMIHCYASYLSDRDDVTLSGTAAAWTNEFCEVVLGGTILIPLAVAYLGLKKTGEAASFGLCFKTLPTLFQSWGWMAPAAGFMWFGLLFFAAITSSLAMGQPIMAFLQTEFRMSRHGSAMALAAMLLPLAAPVAFLSEKTFFDEFDFWAGTVALVVFALIETILFAWVFGMERGWREMHLGAEIRIPRIFFYVIKYVTPTLIAVILVGTIFLPKAGWNTMLTAAVRGEQLPEWQWSGDGLIGRLLNLDLAPPKTVVEEEFQASVRIWRTVCRVALAGSFAGLSALVWLAWRKRAANERTQP
jgi:NSS family neurotransmitter:Na+ symporter